jgi:hypothetical protein
MPDMLVIEARYGGGRLELTPIAHPHDTAAERPTWQARLMGRGFEGAALAGNRRLDEAAAMPGLVAEMVCPESPWEDELLHEYFARLYEERMGWDGELTWVGQHEHLRFVATHDHVNTVSLRIELRGIADPSWLASATLPVDPGLFLQVSRNAKLFADRLREQQPDAETA